MARVGESAPPELIRAGITPRELEVLRCVALRMSNREIADRLVVSTRTVESHVSALLAKLGAGSRRDLAAWAGALLGQPTGRGVPARLDSFVGRSRELDEVGALVGAQRLVTLTGPAGVGKTRLATEVARARGDAGVELVDLTPARADTDVADRVLGALGVEQVPGQEALETLASRGSERPVLVVLDNCEHVLAGCAVLVQTLLGCWPAVRVLATSRQPLGTAGEVVYPVEPLPVPELRGVRVADVVATDAARLLADRAWSAGSGFAITEANAAAVAQLCRSLDGLPLALELIAPRLRTFTAEQLAGRLGDRMRLLGSSSAVGTSRHRTLRRALDWSYETLSEPERSLFTALGVFAGTFSLEAVEAVCTGAVTGPGEVLETFPLLVDRSLVVAVPAGATNRYRLLETLRAYAREQLNAENETLLRARHAAYLVEFAERAEPGLRGASGPQWIDRLRAEQDNLHLALDWSLTHRPEQALRLVAALQRFWERTDQRRSGIEWAERALAAGASPPAARLPALVAAAELIAPWDAARLGELATEAERLAAQLADEHWIARAQIGLAQASSYAIRPAQVDAAPVEAAIAYFRAVGDRWHLASGLRAMCLLQTPEQAVGSLAEARQLFAAAGDRLEAAKCASMRASVFVRHRNGTEQARQLATDALTAFRELESEHEQAHARGILAEIAYRSGDVQQAADAARNCLETFRRVADHRCVSAMLLLLAGIEQDRGDRAAAFALLRETLHVATLGALPRTIPLALERLARLLRGQHPLAAVTLLAAREAHGDPRTTLPDQASDLNALRHATEPAEFETAWQRGAHASLDQLIDIIEATEL